MASEKAGLEHLTRRETIGLLATVGAATLAGCGGGSLSLAGSTPTATATGAATAVPSAITVQTATAAATVTSASASATPAASATPTSVASASPTAAATSPAPASTTPAASATPSPSATPSTLFCVVRPDQTEGPYFVDDMLNRSDIRSDPSDGSVKEGLRLGLTFRVGQVSGGVCTALAGATVDVWHCDALGIYSDVSDPSFNTVGQKFLRGYQATDANGLAQFVTIYPGWYAGRTVHIHFKIRTADQSLEFTSQLYFDDAITDLVHAQAPYSSKGQRTLRNAGDGIYQSGGSQLLLALIAADDGYTATFDIGLEI